MKLPALLAIVSLAPTAAMGADADRSGELRAGLARPLSPGALALVVEHTGHPDVQARLRQALQDPAPKTRAAAARVANVRGMKELVPLILQILETEKDVAAAREEMAALGTLAGAGADDALFAAASRTTGLTDAVIAAVGRRGKSALDLKDRLAAFPPSGPQWADYFVWMTWSDDAAASAQAAETALRVGGINAWAGFLSASWQPIDPLVLARAIDSEDAAIREAACWNAVLRPSGSQAPELRAATLIARSVSTGQSSAGATLACEVLARSLGWAPIDRTAEINGLSPVERRRLPFVAAALERLNTKERKALGKVVRGDAGAVERHLASPPPRVERRPADIRLRTPVDFPPGLVADLLAITDCRDLGKGDWPLGRVKYDARGAIEEIALPPFEGRGRCGPVARALVLLAIEPADRPPKPSSSDLLTIPTDPEFLACLAAEQPRLFPSPPLDGEPQYSGGRAIPHDLPDDARVMTRSAVAFFDVHVGITGCIRGIEMIASERVDQITLLRNIAGWRWEPLRLAGQPIPFRTSVLLNLRPSSR